MAKVKILLEPGETELDANHALQKALEFQTSGESHEESFDDPAMVDTLREMENRFAKSYSDMIKEIIDVLDEEYSDGYL